MVNPGESPDDSNPRIALIKYWSEELSRVENLGNGLFFPPEDLLGARRDWVIPDLDLMTIQDYRRLIATNNTQIDARLVPVPYIGSLCTGSVFIIMANPGLDARDPFQEYAGDPDCPFGQALKKNLIQDEVDYPFLYLDPRFDGFSGSNYWLKSARQNGCQGLNEIITSIAKRLRNGSESPREDARRLLAKHLVVIQGMPYHSVKLPPNGITTQHSRLLPRILNGLFEEAKQKKILLLLYRVSSLWNELLNPHGFARPLAGEDRWISDNIWCVRERDRGRGAIGFSARGDLHERIVDWVCSR